MKKGKNRKLLKDPEVLTEIEKHLWIESEKAEHDIGFDAAADDWLEKYSEDWEEENISNKKLLAKKRRAKSYAD